MYEYAQACVFVYSPVSTFILFPCKHTPTTYMRPYVYSCTYTNTHRQSRMAAEELARIQQEDVKVFFNMVAQHQENFDNIWGKKTLEHKVWMFVLWVGVDVGVYECTYVGKSYVYVCEYVL